MAQRLSAQLLTGTPAGSVIDVVDRLLSVQAQDPRGFRLAIRARTAGLSIADVDRALTEDRSVVVTWLNRGTLHLVRAEDYWWLHALTTPPLLSGSMRRLGQEGVPPDAAERGVAAVADALLADGPLLRAQLRERVAAVDVRVEGQALVHVLFLASLRGLLVRGPVIGGEQAFVSTREWLGPPPPAPDRDSALAELARRYLAGHAPATDRDLAKWSGLSLGDARRGLAVVRSPDPRTVPEPPLPPPRLLGAFDPLLLGWAAREPITGSHPGLVTANGIFRPFALIDGRAAATWRLDGREVIVEPFGRLRRVDTAALRADGDDVVRFLELG